MMQDANAGSVDIALARHANSRVLQINVLWSVSYQLPGVDVGSKRLSRK
jgi:hypothetical protein